jgi:hypothetical protein
MQVLRQSDFMLIGDMNLDLWQYPVSRPPCHTRIPFIGKPAQERIDLRLAVEIHVLATIVILILVVVGQLANVPGKSFLHQLSETRPPVVRTMG